MNTKKPIRKDKKCQRVYHYNSPLGYSSTAYYTDDSCSSSDSGYSSSDSECSSSDSGCSSSD
jgi:hypothetical protein